MVFYQKEFDGAAWLIALAGCVGLEQLSTWFNTMVMLNLWVFNSIPCSLLGVVLKLFVVTLNRDRSTVGHNVQTSVRRIQWPVSPLSGCTVFQPSLE